MIEMILSFALNTAVVPPMDNAKPEPQMIAEPTQGFDSPRALLVALAKKDATVNTLKGEVRFTTIQALEGDIQTRHGWLYLRTDHATEHRDYAVRFDQLIVDQRMQTIDEQYAFDGQWFVERLPEDKQFNKRQIVPMGEKLDPMELMREAPFWVSLGRDTDRVLTSYDTELLDTNEGLVGNEDFPELAGLALLVEGCTQLRLTPKPGSGLEDDWDNVRIWIDSTTLLPRLYIKAEWTGNIQIVELFGVTPNEQIDPSIFSTTTPSDRSGWNIQISPWRGKTPLDEQTINNAPGMEPSE
ncbi:MAG: hypothetical protein JKY96_08450 [Phycisphaerales bacterium]|nr:hypothetical protein [Phycisphaerales bacterium]